jgi:hypothetical protein
MIINTFLLIYFAFGVFFDCLASLDYLKNEKNTELISIIEVIKEDNIELFINEKFFLLRDKYYFF